MRRHANGVYMLTGHHDETYPWLAARGPTDNDGRYPVDTADAVQRDAATYAPRNRCTTLAVSTAGSETRGS